jgi:hypothetical protein
MMAREKLAQTIYARVEHEDPPFLISHTTLAGIGEGLDDGDTAEVAEYKRVRFFKVRRGTVEVK